MKEKLIDLLKKKSTKITIFIILLMVIILIDFMMYSKFIYNERSDYIDDFSEYDYVLNSENTESLDGTIQITQTVTATGNNLEAFSLSFDKEFRTYNDSQINIKFIDKETETVIAEYNNIYDTTSMEYIEHKFTFNKIEDSYAKQYEIIITYENSIDDNSIFYSEENIDSASLSINGENVEGHISFILHYDSKLANTIFTVSMIGTNILAIIYFYLILFKQIKLDKIFLFTISILGIIYVFIIPVYRGHDEPAHFFKAYEISQGIFNTKIVDEQSTTEIPKAFYDIMNVYDEETGEISINSGYYKEVIESLNTEITDEKILIDGSYMAVYSIVPYIPQALSIKIVSLFTNKVIIIFYAARIANLIVSIAILYAAFKIIPYGKKLLFLICLIPTVISQIASMSPDALTFTSTVLFIAYILKLINDNKQITKKNITILTIVGVIIALCKITYIPFAFLALLIPKEQFKNKKSKTISMLVIILIPVIMNLAWLGIAGGHLELIDNNKSSVQQSFILSNPIEYIRTCAYTVYLKLGEFIQGLFGEYLEQLSIVRVGEFLSYIYIVTFALLILFDDEIKDKIKNFGKVLIALVLIITTALIFTSLYMQWSGYKWYFVDGIQGRYFIQFLLPLGLLLAQNNISRNSKINLKTIVLVVTGITNMMAILASVITYI